MRILINENKLDKVVGLFMTRVFDELTIVKRGYFKVSTFFVKPDSKIIAELYEGSDGQNFLVIDYQLWTTISDIFGFKTILDQQESLAKWANKYFDIKIDLVDIGDFENLNLHFEN